MKREIIFGLCLLLLSTSCEWLNNGRGKKLDPEQLVKAMEGGWILNQSGAEETWYFSGDRTYVKLTRYDEEFGTWNYDGKNITLTETSSNESLIDEIVLDNNVLIIGAITLMKDSTAVDRVEEKLSEKIIGQWKSDLEDEIYEFQPNGFMLVKYADEMTEDGRWRINGNQLIENDSEYSAAPISFDGNQLRWSTEVFTRIGDIDPNNLITDTNDDEDKDSDDGKGIQTKGQAISQHSFQANLGNFGRVSFDPYWEDRYGDSNVHYYLSRNGVPVYEFPAMGNAVGKFEGIRAVAARDLNSDGKLDIVVMSDYVSSAPDGGERITGINGVFINKGSSFSFDRNLSQKVNDDEIRTVNDLVAVARKNAPSNSGGQTASTTSSKGATGVNIAKYKGDKSICRIRVASIQGAIDYERINKLSDLGILSFEPADNGFTRVYLGKYIGKYTAYQVLKQVKRRGNPSAFVVVDQDFIQNKAKEDPAFSTYQVSSSKKINLSNFNQLDDQYRGDVYVAYDGGRYRVSLGVFQKDLYPYMEQEFASLGARLGFSDGFAKTIK